MHTPRLWAALLLCGVCLALPAPAAEPAVAGDPVGAGNVRLSLLVIDIDSYLAHKALNGLELPPGFEARVLTLKDLEADPAKRAFVSGSRVVLADVMGSELARYLTDNGLVKSRKVFALRGSRDDQALLAEGFIFDETLAEYYRHLSVANIQNMIRLALDLPGDPVDRMPEDGMYHPEASELFSDFTGYLQWYEARPGHDPARPWLGVMFFTASLIEGQREACDELLVFLEKNGFNIAPAFGRDRDVIEKYLLPGKREGRLDLVLSFALKFHTALNSDLGRAVADLDVPIFNAINLYSQTIDEWRADPRGILPLDVVWNLATPEISGLIEPTPLVGKVEAIDPVSGALVYRYRFMPEQLERLVPRLHNWVRLQKKANAGKKVAILYYNYGQGKQNIGASYLNSFRSLEAILNAMREQGYGIPAGLSLQEEDIKNLVLRSGRNVGSWAPGELEAMTASGHVEELSFAEYRTWFAALPQEFQERVLAQWGPVEQADIMVSKGNIIIPMIRLGQVVIMPEPAVAASDDAARLQHDMEFYPHHQYLAAYLWLKHGFGADAMVHLGTHATYEWTPGKQGGLSPACAPEVLVTDIPNIYPYIVDDVGEGLQAKRRGRGVIIDHLVPPLVAAEGYHEYLELKERIAQFEQAEQMGAGTADTYLAEIQSRIAALGLDKELELEGVDAHEDVEAVGHYLEFMESSAIPYGLHTFGRSPADESIAATTAAMLERNKALDEEAVRLDMKASGPREMQHLLKGLSGGFIPPAEGNDPVRNPASLPTGSNFYGLSPNRLPSMAAWKLGQQAADEIIEKYLAEHRQYPDKVAVVLWAVESLRNEGLNEATVLALIGVEPVWNQNGQITGSRPIPAFRLKRPRIDVTINASGLYRDLFPDKILFLDEAIRLAALQDDLENFIRRNDDTIRQSLSKAGLSEEEAGRLSKARIFSEAPGNYGNRVSELISASGYWEDDKAIAGTYLTHSAYAYGKEFWGAPARPSLEANLKEAKVAWHSLSSQLYGLMDNDDMFAFLGGLSAAVRELSGAAPKTLIADQRSIGRVHMESLKKVIGLELRARYLNPKWIEGMKGENYAGAGEMASFIEYLWGWQVTAPDSVDKSAWEQSYAVYVEDKYGLEIKAFMDENNPWAYQSLTGRMLESIRKGYWEADEDSQKTLAAEYAASVLSKGLACSDATCNNPQLHQMVKEIISLPGVMTPEDVARFEATVETAVGKALAEQLADRMELLQAQRQILDQAATGILGDTEQAAPHVTARATADAALPAEPAADADPGLELVKGYAMEPLDRRPESSVEKAGQAAPSSGAGWLACAFALVILALFIAGLRRGGRYFA